jgi:uroporphyrinogen-III synthase
VQNFAQLVGTERLNAIKARAAFATIGPIAGKTAEDAGLAVSVQPEVHDIPHLVEAIIAWAKR